MTIQDLKNARAVAVALVTGGLPPPAAEQKSALFARCAEALEEGTRGGNASAFFVPGRIEVLGKHTDYAGGDSILCAVTHGFCFVVSHDTRKSLQIINAATGDFVDLLPGQLDQDRGRIGHWSNYPDTVWRRLRDNLGGLEGGTIAFDSDLPVAAGLSSSSALIVGTFLALDQLNAIRGRTEFDRNVPTIESLGDFLGCVENGLDYRGLPGTSGVGTTGGSQDQTAILCARANVLQHFSFSPTTLHESAPMPDGHVFVIASSGVVAEKTGSALKSYNRVGSRANEVVRLWNAFSHREFQTFGEITRSDGFDVDSFRSNFLRSNLVRPPNSSTVEVAPTGESFSKESLLGRFEQFYSESFEIIPEAMRALTEGNVQEFGSAVRRSQSMAERHLENQIPETIALVHLAQEEGAVAASAFGAGFGGSVWAMIPEGAAEAFRSRWASRYAILFPRPSAQSRFFMERPGPGAFKLDLSE